MHRHFRSALTAAAVAILVGSTGAPRAAEGEYGLPDIGSSAAGLLSPAEARKYGEATLRELRGLSMTLDDPLLEDYLTRLGYRLVEQSERPTERFTFFFLRSTDINAWATLGGYIAINAGLFTAADSEDEVAAVLAHEIAHVTQNHIYRAVERAQKDSLPIALAMLGAIVAAQQAGGNSSGDATQAAIAGGLGLLQQRQIDYTRSNEHEADRLGIRSLHRAGYDPLAMAGFFGKLQRANRAGGAIEIPEYLRTHPVNAARISEAKDRARAMGDPAGKATLPSAVGPLSPLLPERFAGAHLTAGSGRDDLFLLARERLRVLTTASVPEIRAEYRRRIAAHEGEVPIEELYGLALAETRSGQPERAIERLQPLAAERPGDPWVELALADAEFQAGRIDRADAGYESLLAQQPASRPIALAYAQALTHRGTPAAARRALEVLRPLGGSGNEDAAFQASYARAAELAGEEIRAAEAYAQAAYLSGRAEDALNQLERLKKRDDLSYYERARVEARIDAILPTVLELRERGIRPGSTPRNGPLNGHTALRLR